MTLYESNYIRLAQLLGSLRDIPDAQVSSPPDDCPLHLQVDERSRYTTTFTLTYRFIESEGDIAREVADPDLQIRVYHDARLGEALKCARWHRHPLLNSLQSDFHRHMDERWQRNVMLNKWLEYCADRGHCFATSFA
jgi:hypothetical protein